ncbi:hypothetical protein HAX54_042984 [Datura stramonium]|uniref:Uncharacterized protein n=1 Tax=Datura stramonium TaxID=4076 RepID=A0ABS8W093_DATST|nr:hypothetical protein [Datura stramonium]
MFQPTTDWVLKDGKINSFDLDELFKKRELTLDLGNLLTGLHLKNYKSSGLKLIEEADLSFLKQGFLVLEEENLRKSSLEESEISTGEEEVEGLLRGLEERRGFLGDLAIGGVYKERE